GSGVADRQPVITRCRLEATRLTGVDKNRSACLLSPQHRPDVWHGREQSAPLCGPREIQAAREVGVSHASSHAPPVWEARGVPPAIFECLDHCPRIVTVSFEESGDANQPIAGDKMSAPPTGENRSPTSGIDDESSE